MPVKVRVVGLEELDRKLDGRLLYEPEIDSTLQRMGDELKRGHDRGKGLGARRNVMAVERAGRLSYRLTSRSLVGRPWRPKALKGPRRPRGSGTPRPGWQERIPTFNPRRTGKAWRAKQHRRFKSMAPRFIRKAIEGIKKRWAS